MFLPSKMSNISFQSVCLPAFTLACLTSLTLFFFSLSFSSVFVCYSASHLGRVNWNEIWLLCFQPLDYKYERTTSHKYLKGAITVPVCSHALSHKIKVIFTQTHTAGSKVSHPQINTQYVHIIISQPTHDFFHELPY